MFELVSQDWTGISTSTRWRYKEHLAKVKYAKLERLRNEKGISHKKFINKYYIYLYPYSCVYYAKYTECIWRIRCSSGLYEILIYEKFTGCLDDNSRAKNMKEFQTLVYLFICICSAHRFLLISYLFWTGNKKKKSFKLRNGLKCVDTSSTRTKCFFVVGFLFLLFP